MEQIISEELLHELLDAASKDPKKELNPHTFTIEKLHHFRCGECGQWWSIGDWKKTLFMSCPKCATTSTVEREGK